MNVWIDLANSPHPLLFAPLARKLERTGHRVLTTARDHAQTVELARKTWPDVVVSGGSSPKSRSAKASTLVGRVLELRRWAETTKPDVAVSHNSYAQIVAARTLGIRAVTAMDYEHQPANHLAFRLASLVLLPEALRGSEVERQGAVPRKTRFYPGLKEELYLGDFEPDPVVLEQIGVSRDEKTRVVVARTAPTGATYHRFENRVFLEALRLLVKEANVRCIVLARDPEQRSILDQIGGGRLIVPTAAIDSRSLMSCADLFLGAGGTMTREAALLDVPTLSVFAGRTPAVDRWLEQHGRLTRLARAKDVLSVEPRATATVDLARLRARGDELLDEITSSITQAAPTAA